MHTRLFLEPGNQNPTFAIEDRIFLGEGLFETLKVEYAKPCFSHLHWQRLGDCATKLGIPFDLSFEDWQDALLHQIKQDNLYHGGIKAILSGGPAARGLTQRGSVSHLIFQCFNYTVNPLPVRLIKNPWLRDSANPVYRLKSVNYLEAILARRQALELNADDALFFNTQSHATETTCANLFLIKNDVLYTPPLSDGVLEGITRKRVLALCNQHQIPCLETSLEQKMLEEADILLVTNCLQGMRAVSSFNGQTLQITHPLFEKMQILLAEEKG